MSTLKNTKFTVSHLQSGSQGQLVLNGDTTGSYNVGPSQSNIVWSEVWYGNQCYLWVVFKNQIDDNVIRIWGAQLALNANTISGYGMAALGNANPQNPTDTSFQNDNLTFTQQS
jgi:hypothetical protein